MDDMLSRSEIERITLRPEQAQTLPARCYLSADFHEREVERVFARSWICVGHAGSLPRPGDYRAVDLAGWQLLLVHGADGVIRALSNSCRHRGTRLLDGSGNAHGLRCPFHNWVYALDGGLRAAPTMEAVPGFCTADHGLPAYETAVWQGLIFVKLTPGGPSLGDWLGDLGQALAPYRLEDMRCTMTDTLTVHCNWKQVIEVFMEDYHLAAVHRQSIAATYGVAGTPEPVRGELTTMFLPHEGTAALLPADQGQSLPIIAGLPAALMGTRYTVVYPSLIFACTIDCMWFFEIYPEGPERTTVLMNMCFPRDSIARPDFAAKVAAYYARWRTAIAEDNAILERQLAGMRSRDSGIGRYSPLEPVVALFARWMIERMARA
jgi:phenylpropionate dioxygenase-like ring-hydroxylating dioxygenase large terminal subunit